MYPTSWFTMPLVTLLIVAALWDLVWKMLAAWRAARNGQKVWFVLILALNTVGILPIIYLLTQPKEQGGTTV